MAAPVRITRDDLDAAGLRRAARRASGVAASRRRLALALVVEGTSRTEAAQAAGMDRRTLRDWVHRTNGQGLAGLTDRHGKFGPKRLLSPEQEAEVAEWVRKGPDLAGHGVVQLRRADLARAIGTRFGVVLAELRISTVLRRLGLRRLVVRPRHPGQDAAAQASFRPASPASWRQSCRSTPAASRWSCGGRTRRASAGRARRPVSEPSAARVPRHRATSATTGPTCSERSVRRVVWVLPRPARGRDRGGW